MIRKIGPPIPEDTGYGDELFVEEFSGRYFLSSKLKVIQAEKRVNELFQVRGYATLNDFYDFLGLPKTELGKRLEWNAYPEYELGVQEVLFDHWMLEPGITNIRFETGYRIKYENIPEMAIFMSQN